MMMSRKYRQMSCEIVTDPRMPQKEEHDGFSCAHCNKNQRLSPMTVRGNVMTDNVANEAIAARCTCCDKLICLACVGKGCRPLEKWLLRMEARRAIAECAA